MAGKRTPEDLINMRRELEAMAVLWRNDTEEGFGVYFIGSKEAQRMLEGLENGDRLFLRKERDKETFLSRVAPAQLLEAGGLQKKQPRTEEEEGWFLTMGPLNVYILQQEGRLKEDEYNGCTFVWKVGR